MAAIDGFRNTNHNDEIAVIDVPIIKQSILSCLYIYTLTAIVNNTKNNGFIPPTLLEDVVVTKEEEVVEEVVEVEESVERLEEEGLGLQTLDV